MLLSGWLDDIGLPQYKSHFDEARVDGRVLHYLTVVSHPDLTSCCIPRDEMAHLSAVSQEDLLSLKVGSVLHHLSIKRAIQVLRINAFAPNCLRRRPSDEVSHRTTKKFPLCLNVSVTNLPSCWQNNITPAEICQWTNHRVMEWLRSVDLAEYAPNLRGSGVHGGLMVRGRGQESCSPVVAWICSWRCLTLASPLQVLEPRFNVEALALLLNIPPNKTLLRRHLATHFHLLIGAEAQRLKQEYLENPDYTVLTATARVKVLRPPNTHAELGLGNPHR